MKRVHYLEKALKNSRSDDNKIQLNFLGNCDPLLEKYALKNNYDLIGMYEKSFGFNVGLIVILLRGKFIVPF